MRLAMSILFCVYLPLHGVRGMACTQISETCSLSAVLNERVCMYVCARVWAQGNERSGRTKKRGNVEAEVEKVSALPEPETTTTEHHEHHPAPTPPLFLTSPQALYRQR